MTIYQNSPAWMRPDAPYQLVVIGTKIVNGKAVQVTENGNFISERVGEIARPKFTVSDGPEDLNAIEWVADVWDMVEYSVPWARCVLGPRLAIMDAMGQWHSPKSFIADSLETIEGGDSDTVFRITTLAVSTNQSRQEAVRAALGIIWRELEAEATHDDAFGPEWATAIDDSLAEVQAAILSDPNASPESRRADAFVTFAVNALNGGGEADRAEETPHAYRQFAKALSGDLGRLLAMYRNGLE